MIHKENLKKIKLKKIFLRLISVTLIFLINFTYILPPLSYAYGADVVEDIRVVEPNELIESNQRYYLERQFGPEQIIEFNYESLDDKSPTSDEYVQKVRDAILPFGEEESDNDQSSGGSEYVGPNVAELQPAISNVTSGIPVVAMINARDIITENFQSYQNADPLVIRVTGVDDETTVDEAIASAQQIANLGLPAQTIIVYGNELNNLEVEWKNTGTTVEDAAIKYDILFREFSSIIKNAGLRVAPGPPDLYNSKYSGEAWANTAAEQGVYSNANALVANVYDLEDNMSLQDSINKLQSLSGLSVDFITEIGPDPASSVQEHLEFLNNVEQLTNSNGEPLRASSLVANTCNHRSKKAEEAGIDKDFWLFYAKGDIYDLSGDKVIPEGDECKTGPSNKEEDYDAVTVVGRVLSNIQLPDAEGVVKPNKGLEGYVVLAFEHIDFGETSYYNWTHLTTTNENGKFAIPIDTRAEGAFLTILKPEAEGFRLINSYDVSADIDEENDRSPENGIITLGEIKIDEPLYIEEPFDLITNIPEVVNIYSRDKEAGTENYYSCTNESNIYWESYNREFEVPLQLEDDPFMYNIQQEGSERGKSEDNNKTFEIFSTDDDGKDRSLECINNIMDDIYSINELGDDDYFRIYEGENFAQGNAEGNACFNYNEPFIPLTDKYLYTNFKVKQGLLSIHYLKSTSGAANFYNGPANYINPYESNSNILPSCDEFIKSRDFDSGYYTSNRRTYNGISNLALPGTTDTKSNIGLLDSEVVNRTPACQTSDGTQKTYGQLLDEGYEISDKFLLDSYLGLNGNTTFTELSTIIDNDNIKNDMGSSSTGNNLIIEKGRDSTFGEDGENFSKKAAATFSSVSDVELDNRNIYGDGSNNLVEDNSSKRNGFYHSFLTPYAENNDNDIYIYEIGPQRSLCEQVYSSSDDKNTIYIENESIDLYPNEDDESAYSGWLYDNKNITGNDGSNIDSPTNTNNWLFSSFFGKKFDDDNEVKFNKLTDEVYLTFDNYLKEIKDPNKTGDGGNKRNSMAEFLEKAFDGGCIESDWEVIIGLGIIADIENDYMEGSRDKLWRVDEDHTCDTDILVDENGQPILDADGNEQEVLDDDECTNVGNNSYGIGIGYKKLQKATKLKYVCSAINENKMNIKSQDIRKEETAIREERSLNDNSLMIRDIFMPPYQEDYKKPYTIGKKRVELYSFLEVTKNYEEEDIKSGGPFAQLLAGIGSLFGRTKPEDDSENEILTYVRLISDKSSQNNSEDLLEDNFDAKNIEPAGSNLDWLRTINKLPTKEKVSPYNNVIYRDINIKEREKGRVLLTAGTNVYEGSSENNYKTPPSGQFSCPVQCEPELICSSYDENSTQCNHGSLDYYWNIIDADTCQYPIPTYDFGIIDPGRKPYSPEGIEPSVHCAPNYNRSMDAGIANSEIYGYAADIIANCSNDKSIIAPLNEDLEEWRVTGVYENGSNSSIFLEGNTRDGVVKLYLHHLDENSITVNASDWVSTGTKIARYSRDQDHLHMEMSVGDEIVKPEEYFRECGI